MERTNENPGINIDLTFISIHDLTPEAHVLYSSESILDVLGYTPDEIVNRSLWDFLPPEELPYAKQYQQNGVAMDKAAMLAYCRIRDKNGEWICCECCFTIVYDVMVVCTSVYHSGQSSQKRALEAPLIRRMFSSSPRDPRYHMLSHISQKFNQPSKIDMNEPRAALFLNRFTRTLTIMYATNGLEDILGIPADVLRGRSFYYCIAENCLQDAIKCLETAKGNNSIAYLRFWFRDPRLEGTASHGDPSDDSDEEMATDTSVDQEFGGGVNLEDNASGSDDSSRSNAVQSDPSMDVDRPDGDPQSRTSSGDSTEPRDTHEAIFGESRRRDSSSVSGSPDEYPPADSNRMAEPVELEAVISCASDGLVVCLRRARPMIPQAVQRPARPAYERGLFAAPWAEEPLVPALSTRPQYGYSTTFAPSLGPNAHRQVSASGPERDDFMSAIRDQAIFAWALTSINGSLQRYSSGTPRGESVPSGLPIWQCDKSSDTEMKDAQSRTDSASSGLADGVGKPPPYANSATVGMGNDHRKLFGDPGLFGHQRSPSAVMKTAGNGGPHG